MPQYQPETTILQCDEDGCNLTILLAVLEKQPKDVPRAGVTLFCPRCVGDVQAKADAWAAEGETEEA